MSREMKEDGIARSAVHRKGSERPEQIRPSGDGPFVANVWVVNHQLYVGIVKAVHYLQERYDIPTIVVTTRELVR
jgi:hypothetical protein